MEINAESPAKEATVQMVRPVVLPSGECLMVCVWVPNPHKEMNQNDYYGETRSG